MRLFALLLLVLVGLIQYPLWLGKGGWFATREQQIQLGEQLEVNEGLRARNQALDAEVRDLRTGTEALEERARGELSMMRQEEIFVRVLPHGAPLPEIRQPPATNARQAPARPR